MRSATPKTTKHRDCAVCEGREPILPVALYEDIKAGSVVLFAGAGVSTESGPHGTPTLYDEIAHELGGQRKRALAFPDLMQRYCKVVDGGQKHRLTRRILDRIERFAGPGEAYAMTTMMHRDIARVPYITRIVTTNWDPFFERELNILVPIVEDRDVAFWDDSKRQVLKIHGCATRPYTMVATRDDYDRCLRANKLVFNKLRDLLATKTFLFAGFSLRDPDFALVFDQITRRLGGFRRLCYVVDPDAVPAAAARWRKRKVQIIRASGVAMSRDITTRLAHEDLIVSDDYLRYLWAQQDVVTRTHLSTQQDSDGAFASSMYQDGLVHSLSHVISGSQLGVLKETFQKERDTAHEALTTYWDREDALEIAYWSGRAEVMDRFCRRTRGEIPRYFDPYELVPRRKFRAGNKRGYKAPLKMVRFDKRPGKSLSSST